MLAPPLFSPSAYASSPLVVSILLLVNIGVSNGLEFISPMRGWKNLKRPTFSLSTVRKSFSLLSFPLGGGGMSFSSRVSFPSMPPAFGSFLRNPFHPQDDGAALAGADGRPEVPPPTAYPPTDYPPTDYPQNIALAQGARWLSSLKGPKSPDLNLASSSLGWLMKPSWYEKISCSNFFVFQGGAGGGTDAAGGGEGRFYDSDRSWSSRGDAFGDEEWDVGEGIVTDDYGFDDDADGIGHGQGKFTKLGRILKNFRSYIY